MVYVVLSEDELMPPAAIKVAMVVPLATGVGLVPVVTVEVASNTR